MSEQSEADVQLILKALETLSEHFDSVHLFATRHESGEKHGTLTWQRGIGNWYTRYGQIREWINGQEERARQETRDEIEGEKNE